MASFCLSADQTDRATQLATASRIQGSLGNAERFFNIPVQKCSVPECSIDCFNESVLFCRTHLCSRFTNNGCKRGGKEVNHYQFGKKKCVICRQNQHKSYRKRKKFKKLAAATAENMTQLKNFILTRNRCHINSLSSLFYHMCEAGCHYGGEIK